MPRDRGFERIWLERAARDPEFAPLVAARLDRASAEHGEDGFRSRTLEQLLGEIEEEGLDVAGWGVLARQLEPPPGIDPGTLERIDELLAEAAEHGARISLLMRTAGTLLPHDAPA